MGFPYSSGDVLTAADLNQSSGLVFIKRQSMASGSTSTTVTNAFSSDFRNYRIIITRGTCTSDGSIEMRLGSATTNYYSNLTYVAYGGTSWGFLSDVNGSKFSYVGSHRTTGTNVAINIYNPFVSGARTIYDGVYVGAKTTSVTGITGGFHNVAQSHSDVTFIVSAGSVNNASDIRIYGFNDG